MYVRDGNTGTGCGIGMYVRVYRWVVVRTIGVSRVGLVYCWGYSTVCGTNKDRIRPGRWERTLEISREPPRENDCSRRRVPPDPDHWVLPGRGRRHGCDVERGGRGSVPTRRPSWGV